jgi:signal transduction histidine kinase
MEETRAKIVKGKPIFKRHLYISSFLFILVILLATFFLIHLARNSWREQTSLEIRFLGEEYSQQVRDYISSNSLNLGGENRQESLRQVYLLNNFIDRLLLAQEELAYLFVQDLSGDILGQGIREGMELEKNQFSRLLFLPRNPRPPSQEFPALTNLREILVDQIVPVSAGDPPQMVYIHIGLNKSLVERRFRNWQGTVTNRILATAGGLLAILTLVLAYVLWLIKRAQIVEAEAHLADRMAYIGTLASGLAHEIRNPLSAMNLNLQMIEEEMSDSPCASAMGTLIQSTRQEIKRLERLAGNFLLYAKPLQLAREKVSLNQLLENVSNLVRQECEKAGIELEVLQDPANLTWLGDPDLLQQAFLNLVRNAMEAFEESSSLPKIIRLQSAKLDNKLCLRVADSGSGVRPEDARNLFKLFYSSKRGGTGLGLAIAQRIVEAHGGSIEWRNLPQGGAEFAILL